ncbi:MAG: molybdopterin biosynthesis protein MoeA, partial [Actinomycetota bacterium]
MIPLEDARALVFRSVRRLDPVTLPITDASLPGSVLADDVTAAEAVPPFANTAVDGYALRAADTANVPAELVV